MVRLGRGGGGIEDDALVSGLWKSFSVGIIYEDRKFWGKYEFSFSPLKFELFETFKQRAKCAIRYMGLHGPKRCSVKSADTTLWVIHIGRD